ncbi:MAG: hypothetical protein PVG63_00210 [Anaerolineales bacterium]|jgi:hypothetical protein
MPAPVYQWTERDQRRYIVSLIPFLIAVILGAAVIWSYSWWLLAAWMGLYLLVNLFQAGCCVGCPYRGRYCPAILGITLSNWLSKTIYAEREFNASFFQRNATAAEIVLVAFMVFPLPWLVSVQWILAALYLLFLASHFVLFMPTQCEHCGYNQTCPGGQSWLRCKTLLRR